jgi:hypothetical protein
VSAGPPKATAYESLLVVLTLVVPVPVLAPE